MKEDLNLQGLSNVLMHANRFLFQIIVVVVRPATNQRHNRTAFALLDVNVEPS